MAAYLLDNNSGISPPDSIDADSSGTVDAAVERAYRRGFFQGAYLAIQETRNGVGEYMLDEWREQISAWRYHDHYLDTGRVPVDLPPTEPSLRYANLRTRPVLPA